MSEAEDGPLFAFASAKNETKDVEQDNQEPGRGLKPDDKEQSRLFIKKAPEIGEMRSVR
jgi:hypothetical protein